MTKSEITIEIMREPLLENLPITVVEIDGVYHEKNGPGKFYQCTDSVFVFAGIYTKDEAIKLWGEGSLPPEYIYSRKSSDIQ